MRVILACLLATLLPGSYQQCLSDNDVQVSVDPSSRLSLYRGQQVFSLNLLKALNERTPRENVFFSPFSVYTALMLSYFVAANQTEASIKKVLQLPPSQSKVSTMHAYTLEKLFQNMRSNGSAAGAGYQFITANRLFVNDKEQVRECMESIFNDELKRLDFGGDPRGSARAINSWISETTRHQIQDLIPDDALSSATRLVLANAAYFKGIWKSRFPPENTKNDNFYSSNSEVTPTRMMRQKSTFNHLASEKLGAHVVEVPYLGEDVSLYLVLPPFASPSGVTHLLERLTPEALSEMVAPDSLLPRPVELIMPKFSIEHDVDDLDKVLEKMGVGDLFRPSADLSTLTGRPGLGLDQAVHKAKIKLDEEGTTAAAATAFFHFRSSRPAEPAKVEANHPFIYFIYDKTSYTLLFCGILNKPTEKPI